MTHVHGERFPLDPDLAQRPLTEPGDDDRLFHARVRLLGDVDGVPRRGRRSRPGQPGRPGQPHRPRPRAPRATGRLVQGRGEGHEHRARGTVLDDTAAGPVRPEPAGKPEHLGEPVEHVLLEFGAGRARRPEHPLHAQTRRDQIAEHRGPGDVGGEVAEEPRMLPVRDAGEHDPVEVAEQRLERLGLLGRMRGQQLAQFPGGCPRLDRQRLDPLPVVRDPVDHLPPVAAELLGRHARHAPTVGQRPRACLGTLAGGAGVRK